jgi:superkiller protein 3
MRREGPSRKGILALACVLALSVVAVSEAAVKPRTVVVVPFDATALDRDHHWAGEGIAQILSLGLAQHAAFIPIDRARLRVPGRPDVWSEALIQQAVKAVRVDAVLFGQVARSGADLVVNPRLLETRGTGTETVSLEPLTVTDADFLTRLSALPSVYARSRMEKAARPTQSLRAVELYARGQTAARRGGQEGNEAAVDLLTKAIETDPTFAVAQYTLGSVHQALGNRWKAAAQFRASTQLDASYPEPYKALGDLLLAAPRRLFDQAVEAYTKAIDLRPFYADAHVGLGDARAAKGDVDGAISAYQKALVFNPMNPRVHMSLGKIYYSEKSLYYESVTAYKKAIDLDPQSVEARMGLGEVYEDKGLYKEAIAEYTRVIELDTKHTGALYNLALVYEKVDPKESIVQWERYISLASQLPSEKDWVDVARQHLRKLKSQIKE